MMDLNSLCQGEVGLIWLGFDFYVLLMPLDVVVSCSISFRTLCTFKRLNCSIILMLVRERHCKDITCSHSPIISSGFPFLTHTNILFYDY